MHQQKQIRLIEEVQEAESNATKMLADANAEKERIILGARERASKTVADATSEAKSKSEIALKKFSDELYKKGKNELEKAASNAKALRRRRLSKIKRKELVGRLIRSIFGA